jgi:hypothetical protein
VTTYNKTAYATTASFIGLGLLLCFTSFISPRASAIKNPTPTDHPLSIPVVPSAAGADPTGYATIDERPIFLATRRPPPPAVKPVDYSAASTDAPVSLLGVLIMRGKKVATVLRKTDREAITLSVGQTIGPWTVTDSNAVFMRSGDSGEVLRLADDKTNTTKTK